MTSLPKCDQIRTRKLIGLCTRLMIIRSKSGTYRAVGPMAMTPSARLSLFALRAYLILMTSLVAHQPAAAAQASVELSTKMDSFRYPACYDDRRAEIGA